MIRGIEILMFLAPVVAFVVWRRFGAGRMVPTRTALIVACIVLVAMIAGLAWTGLHERHAEGTLYVPAQMRNGQIVPGHDA